MEIAILEEEQWNEQSKKAIKRLRDVYGILKLWRAVCLILEC